MATKHLARLLGAVLGIGLITDSAASAASEERHGGPSHGAHVHGESRLNLAREGKQVEIELEAPGADIVGFESAPKSATQHKKVETAMGKLRNGATLFAFPSDAGCRLAEAEVESPFKEEHGHGHHKNAEEAEHSEFHAHYHFECQRPGELNEITVRLFEAFPGMQKIKVQAILPGGQRSAVLTTDARRIRF